MQYAFKFPDKFVRNMDDFAWTSLYLNLAELNDYGI